MMKNLLVTCSALLLGASILIIPSTADAKVMDLHCFTKAGASVGFGRRGFESSSTKEDRSGNLKIRIVRTKKSMHAHLFGNMGTERLKLIGIEPDTLHFVEITGIGTKIYWNVYHSSPSLKGKIIVSVMKSYVSGHIGGVFSAIELWECKVK